MDIPETTVSETEITLLDVPEASDGVEVAGTSTPEQEVDPESEFTTVPEYTALTTEEITTTAGYNYESEYLDHLRSIDTNISYICGMSIVLITVFLCTVIIKTFFR